MKDDEGKWIPTKIRIQFYLDFGKYKNTIVHSDNCLTELYIQSGFRKFSGFSREWY